MPGKGHLPDLQERILRGLKANTNRTVGGLGSNASPGMTRDRVAAMRRGSPATGTTTARGSKVDVFEIDDDSQSSFTLTYAPVVDSWNLELNGARVHGSEFSITGRTLHVVDAADLFLGADAQGSPWDMEIQYDYLTGAPTSPRGDLAVIGKPWTRWPGTGDNRYVWFNLDGFTGDPEDITVATYDGTGGLQASVTPALNGPDLGPTIWVAIQTRPWYEEVPAEGVEIIVDGVTLYHYDTDPIHVDASDPPDAYDGTGL